MAQRSVLILVASAHLISATSCFIGDAPTGSFNCPTPVDLMLSLSTTRFQDIYENIKSTEFGCGSHGRSQKGGRYSRMRRVLSPALGSVGILSKPVGSTHAHDG